MANRQFLNMSPEEKNFVENVSSITCIDSNTIKEVLQGLLKAITIEYFSGSKEITIPYICSFEINAFEKLIQDGVKTIIELNAEASKHLIKEIKAINEGEILPTQEYTRQNIYNEIEKTVE